MVVQGMGLAGEGARTEARAINDTEGVAHIKSWPSRCGCAGGLDDVREATGRGWDPIVGGRRSGLP